MKALECFILALALARAFPRIEGCNRVPLGTTAAKSPVDDNYVLSVNGNTQSYVPGQRYNGELFMMMLLQIKLIINIKWVEISSS